MADNLIIIGANHRQLYHSLLQHNIQNNLQSWMRHILVYLTASNNSALLPAGAVQEPPLLQQHLPERCDGSCDCSLNWIRETSYEDFYRKLLMSRINAGDTNRANSVDNDSLQHEALQVIESVNEVRAAIEREQDEDIIIEIESETSSNVDETDWEFLMYDSDESDVDMESDTSDFTYKPSGSELLRLNSSYTSESSISDFSTPVNERNTCKARNNSIDDYSIEQSEYSSNEYYSNNYNSFDESSQNDAETSTDFESDME